MRFGSINGRSWIEIRPWTDHDNDYSAYELEAHLEIHHGTFTANNGDNHWLDLTAFVDGLAAFADDPGLRPQLNGTSDSYLRVRGAGRCLALDFCIGNADCGRVASEPRLTGSFEISWEVLSALTHFVRQLSLPAAK